MSNAANNGATVDGLAATVDGLMGELTAALGKLTVRVVTRWAAPDVPHVSCLRAGDVYHTAWVFCPPPEGWHQWKAVAVGFRADVDAYVAVKARLDAAVANLLAAARAA